jgi:two-component system phosphate regulon sensor histidine kinase PhoR
MWRSRIFWRLFGTTALLLSASLGLLSWLVVQRLEAHVLDEVRRSLETKALLVGELLLPQKAADWPAHVAQVAAKASVRVTLIQADGQVLADSDERTEHMDNHGDRAEIREARESASGVGHAVRHSTTLQHSLMYVVRRSNAGSERLYVRLALPLDRVEAEMSWLRRVVWAGFAGTLLLALAVTVLLARRISAPLVELAENADQIARGDYGKRVNVTATGEIGELAASFNAMSQALAAHIAALDQERQHLRAVFTSMMEGVLVIDAEQNVRFLNEAAADMLSLSVATAPGRKLWQLVRHRQLSDAVDQVLSTNQSHRCELEWETPERRVFALHGARVPGEPLRGALLVFHDITPLRKLESVRQEFVANVSHELKTPLASIQASVETLLNGALEDPGHNVRFLERIRENAERLHRLVQDLLSLGRIESGNEVFELKAIDLADAVAACVTRQSDRAHAKELELLQKPPPEPVTVHADEEALAEILDNLVDNAIKYSARGGQITLRWRADGEEALLEVVDTGVGIPAKDLPRIFERFYRVDKARSRELGGTGLGLSIVKHLAQALKGSVSAVSDIHRGSTFSVRLPRVHSANESHSESSSNLHIEM